MSDLVARLRAQLIAIPKPGTSPRPQMAYEMMTIWCGGKAGDDAGIRPVGICGTVQEHIFAVEPLCEEAAKEIERLQALLRCADAWVDEALEGRSGPTVTPDRAK